MSRYFAASAKGIEQVTADELKRLGITGIEQVPGGVYFEGDTEALYKANLWLRTSTRVLLPVREFAAKTSEMLYDQVRRLKWETILDPSRTFAVTCTFASSGQTPPGIRHSRYAALKIKDAIADQMRLKMGARSSVDTEDPDVRVHAYFRDNRCQLSLDSSGKSLHERGYRLQGAAAPLKETLAAAIIELTGWDGKTPFIDPMSGSGTLPLEAALKAMNIAPGLLRQRFGFQGWADYDEPLWSRLVEEAQGKALYRPEAPIVGYDRDRGAVSAAIENAKRAGLSKMVHFEKREITALEPVGDRPGVVVVNPPYGERLEHGADAELQQLYKTIGDLFKQRMKGWTGFIFTGNLELAKHVGLRTSRRIELYNGPIECRLLKYDLY